MRLSWNNRPQRVRQLERSLAPHLIYLFARLMISSYRLHKVEGLSNLEPMLREEKALLPCFWHHQIVYCTWFLVGAMKRGLKLGFLVSPSRDGNIGARLFDFLGVRCIRGSSSVSGAKSLRDIYLAITKDGLSIASAPDGPQGPPRVFKQGWVNLSRLTGAAMLPLAYAADRAWILKTWDHLVIPKPFARIVLVVGEPVVADKSLNEGEMQTLQDRMEDELNRLSRNAREMLGSAVCPGGHQSP